MVAGTGALTALVCLHSLPKSTDYSRIADVSLYYHSLKINSTNIKIFPGYDQIPIDSMQGLEIGSGFGMDMDIGEAEEAGAASADLAFPEPPHDNNNVAAWYDTDL